VHRLTQRWAAQSGASVFVVTFLVSRRGGWTADDYLGEAVSGLPTDVLGADATRGELSSIRLRFLAPDETTARTWGQQAMMSCDPHANFTDALRVRPGRLTPVERAGMGL